MTSGKTIKVVKTNCFGNSFVIIDETEENRLEESEYRSFAGQVLDVNFGLGADNLLVIQRNSREVWKRIEAGNGFCDQLPECSTEYIFRMFEPDGSEALCCGNGLMSIANYLNDEYGIQSSTIATEIPLNRPNVMHVGTEPVSGLSWVNLGEPRQTPEGVVGGSAGNRFVGNIQVIDDLLVQFREHDLKPYTGLSQIKLSGYLIFTGEPHLVVFTGKGGISVPELSDPIFADSEGNRGAGPMFKQRLRFGTWLVDRIGHYLNSNYKDKFPIGININYVSFTADSACLEYRCFERGINRETLACGTGAMAVTYVTKQLYGLTGNSIKVFPHRCRWYRRSATIEVRILNGGWYLHGLPDIALRGNCAVPYNE